jgi:hypothetical protein
VAYSTDGMCIATARREDSVIMVLDTLSTIPQQSFNTNMQILDIKIVDNTIFVVDRCKFVSWHLEAGAAVCCDDISLEVADNEIVTAIAASRCLVLSNDCSQIAFTDRKTVSLYNI